MKSFDLKKLRADENLRQSDVAALFKCGQSNISAIEKGSRGLEDYQRDILVERFGEEKVLSYESKEICPAVEAPLKEIQRVNNLRLKDKLFPDAVVEKLDDLEQIRIEQHKSTTEALARAMVEISELRKQLSEVIKTNQKLTDKLLSLIN